MTKGLQRCSAVFSSLTGDDQWVQVFPAGKITAYDGRKFTLSDPAAVVAASMRALVDLPVDREHGRELLPPGSAVPAAGWIKELQVRNGEIWARVEWTPPAREQLSNKEFRYISPVFLADKQGNVKQITGASLVNSPAFEMMAVASSQADNPSQPNKENTNMADENKTTPMTAVALLLGLPADADATAIAEEVAELKATLSGVASALGLGWDAPMASYASAITATSNPDPARFVPVANVTALQTENAELKKQIASVETAKADAAATAAVEKAVKDGKLSPALKEWGLSLAKSNMPAFDDFVAKAPAITAPGNTTQEDPNKKKETASADLDEDELAICAATGVSPEDFKKAKAANPA